MTALPNECYSGCHKATEEEDDRETLGKEIWRRKCGQRASGSAGRIWRRQQKIEKGKDEWSMTYAPQGMTVIHRHWNQSTRPTQPFIPPRSVK